MCPSLFYLLGLRLCHTGRQDYLGMSVVVTHIPNTKLSCDLFYRLGSPEQSQLMENLLPETLHRKASLK